MAASESNRSGALQDQVLVGWRAIVRRISERVGIEVSINTARRMAQRERDPLPLKRWGGSTRPHVVIDSRALDAWCDRQWVARGLGEEEAGRAGSTSIARVNASKDNGEG